MAETKNYVSKYSGDQLDAAIAVLGSLGTMFFSQDDFKDFVQQFNTRMDELTRDVKTMKYKAQDSLAAAKEAQKKADQATTAANAATAKVTEIASKDLINYEEIKSTNG